MTARLQVYKCMLCGNIVEVLHSGKGELICCGQPMHLFTENTEDAAREKHVPVLTKEKGKVAVKVGSAEHPMEEAHYIEWIELIAGDKIYRKFLKPGEKPVAVFDGLEDAEDLFAREYCNLHGLWKA
ncbi:MAG: desulfoferrodoxin [Dethiobacteria bacterium]|jgi:superoxide reductase